MGMNVGKLLGWGISIYALVFLLFSAFLTYGFVEGYAPRIIGFLALVVICITAGRSLNAHSWLDILPYSLAWGTMMFVLDVVMSVPIGGWAIFTDWNVWFGYAVVVIAPLFALYPRFDRISLRTARV